MRKRKKRKDVSEEGFTTILGIAWYTPEQYVRLLEIAADPENLEDTYEQWKASAENALVELEKPGIVAHKVYIDVEELLRWCNSRNRPLDGAARSEYTSEKLTEQVNRNK